MNAYKRIQSAMRQNERDVLAHIRRAEQERGSASFTLASSSWYNALDRLIIKKKVRYSKNRFGYVTVKSSK